MWRLDQAAGEEEKDRMARAADFAFRQAWALCPTSPEAVFRYINFLLKQKRNSDALLVASTCQKLDPNNAQIKNLVSQLQQFERREIMVAPLLLTNADIGGRRLASEILQNRDNCGLPGA